MEINSKGVLKMKWVAVVSIKEKKTREYYTRFSVMAENEKEAMKLARKRFREEMLGKTIWRALNPRIDYVYLYNKPSWEQ